MKVSVLVPAYEMGGLGQAFLSRNLDSIMSQSLETVTKRLCVEIVVSDHSPDGELRGFVESLSMPLGFEIRYERNESRRGSASANLNFAFSKSSGEIIKILFQDDFFMDELALARIVARFDENPRSMWLVSGCSHSLDGLSFFATMVPRYHNDIHLGSNTISSPSVLSLRRSAWLGFDTRLRWLLDVDYYKAMHDAFGAPIIVNESLVANGIGHHQVTSQGISQTKLLAEKIVVSRKYGPAVSHVVLSEIRGLLVKAIKTVRKKIRVFRERFFSGRVTPECAGQLTRVDVLNRVIASIGATRYLEIGVNTPDQPGYSRDSIAVKIKHGVDPNPETAADFIETSDSFFASKKAGIYDVIFIDGLHLFEQAYRDLSNSLDHLSERGVIALHDTRPTQRFSASRRQGRSSKWHGDVWRSAYMLRLIRKDIEMVTVDTDEGITLVWRSQTPSTDLDFTNDEIFSWKSYVQTYKSALCLISDDEFLRRFPVAEGSDEP